MKIHLASDLHAEFHGPRSWPEVLESFDGEADVLVLAGDIAPLRFTDQIVSLLRPFCDRYPNVIYVPGNHEYYGSDVETCSRVLNAAPAALSNLIVLRNNSCDLGSHKFYGGTMWFQNLSSNWKHKDQLNDFRMIRRFEPWVYEQNKAFHAGLQGLGPGHIVVSHHLPSMGSCHPRYRQYGMDSLNAFFVDPAGEEQISIGSPKLWLHGHTHEPCDWMAGDTRVVCNPYGYAHEMFEMGKPVELDV